MRAFHILCGVLWGLCTLQVTIASTLSVYHQRSGQFVKRGEITGLPGVPIYQPTPDNTADAQLGKDSLYQVKIKNESSGAIMLSSVKYCQLVGSNWNDLIRVHLDDQNKVYHFDYHALGSQCKTLDSQQTIEPFNTTIKAVKAVNGPALVPGQAPSKKRTTQQPRQAAGKDVPLEEEVEEEKSFFQRYWYIILAGGLILISNLGPPSEEERAPAQR